jgi:hypothetical protein
MSRFDLNPRYFTPAIKPRFKPRVGGRLSPYGITKPQIKPRILPTPIKSVTSSVGGGGGVGVPHIAKPSVSSLLTATHSGTTAPKQSKPAAPPPAVKTNRISSNPRPAGYKPPPSTVAKRPGTGPTKPKMPKMPKMPKVHRVF